jgi:23S rRNA (guanine2535-N1)-methyltransferase
MPYRFALTARSYSDLASGRVLRSAPGQPAFPVRLAQEMFEQACALVPSPPEPGLVLWDPCCGAGHLLASIGLLYPSALSCLVGSDVDPRAVALARQNLELVRPGGLQARIVELEGLHQQHQKPAHRDAIASARALYAQLQGIALDILCFVADATQPQQLSAGLQGRSPDLLLVDLPYGRLSSWAGAAGPEATPEDNARRLLDAWATLCRPGSVAALASPRSFKVTHPDFRRARQLRVGARRLTWLLRN